MIFLSTGGFKNKTAFESACLYNSYKIKNVELSAGKFSPNIKNELKILKKMAKIKLHNYFPPPEKPIVLNLCSTNRNNISKTISHIKNSIILTNKIDGKYFSFHAGFRFDPMVSQLGKKMSKKKLLDKKIAYKLFRKRIIYLNKFAKKYKVKLLIENNVISKKNIKVFGENPFLLTNPKEIIDFFRDLDPNVGLLLDVAHLKVSSNSEKFNLIEGYKKIYPLIDAFHLSDNNGEEDSNSIIKKNSWFLKRLKKNLDYYSIEVYIDDIKKLKKQIELVNKYL